MEERAKRELGMLPSKETTIEDRIRGKFVEQTSHLKRQQEKEKTVSSKLLILIAVLVAMILYVLLR